MICLTFDTDHLDEQRMREFVAATPLPGAATFFCTQVYESIGVQHEICAHVTIDPGEPWDATLDDAQRQFPKAKGFRAHGCFYSHGLALDLAQRGYEYISTQDQSGRRDVVPQREIWGIWQLPIYYIDTFDISVERHWGKEVQPRFSPELLEIAISGPGLYVFAFHPIHLMLNSTGVDAYLARRDGFRGGEPIGELRCSGHGAASYYADLISGMESAGVTSVSLAEALERRSEFEALKTPSGT